MATIYELTDDWKRLMEYIEDPDVDQDVLLDAWLDLDEELEAKADGYAKIMAEEKARADALKAESDRLTARRKAIESNLERLKRALEQMMESTGKTKFKTELFSFGIQKNPPTVKIKDADAVPIDYMVPQPMKVDMTAVKNYLKSLKEGETCEWASLEQGESLRIR